MRKVSSAPSLVEVGSRASLDHHQGPRMGPKATSHGSLSRLGGNHPKEEKRKERTHAFAADGHPIEYAHPSDQVLPEEFAESAKGLAGMDCFELYGGTRTAPALRVTNARDANIEREAADDANAYALASCLNTPYTGEDKNLGELVNSQTREETEAAADRLEAQYQKEVSSQAKDRVVDMEDRELSQPRLAGSARRRRLLELLGLDFSDDSQKDALSSEEQSDIEHLLMTSLEDESQKRVPKPREWRKLVGNPYRLVKTKTQEGRMARCAPQPVHEHIDSSYPRY